MHKIVLQESKNPHILEADEIEIIAANERFQLLAINGNGIIHHGEHGALHTNTPFLLKYTQQEIDPLTNNIYDVFD